MRDGTRHIAVDNRSRPNRSAGDLPGDISGLVVPILTPFDSSDGIDARAFIAHLEFLMSHGVRRILVAGTTGEFFSLTQAERRSLLRLARRHCDVTVCYHVSRNVLKDTVEETRWAQDHGADAVVVAAPYYLAGVPRQGLIDYFRAVSETATVPLLLYNFPRHSQNPLSPDILNAVPHYGIKDSSRDLSLIAHTPRYFVGGDAYVASAFDAGACGFVSAQANQVPWLHSEMEQALGSRDAARREILQKRMTEVSQAFSGVDQAAKLKYALSRRIGKYPARVRPPLASLGSEEAERIAAFLTSFDSAPV